MNLRQKYLKGLTRLVRGHPELSEKKKKRKKEEEEYIEQEYHDFLSCPLNEMSA